MERKRSMVKYLHELFIINLIAFNTNPTHKKGIVLQTEVALLIFKKKTAREYFIKWKINKSAKLITV